MALYAQSPDPSFQPHLYTQKEQKRPKSANCQILSKILPELLKSGTRSRIRALFCQNRPLQATKPHFLLHFDRKSPSFQHQRLLPKSTGWDKLGYFVGKTRFFPNPVSVSARFVFYSPMFKKSYFEWDSCERGYVPRKQREKSSVIFRKFLACGPLVRCL